MDHNLRPFRRHDPPDPGAVPNVGNHGANVEGRPAGPELGVDLEDRVLAMTECHDPRRPDHRHLPAQLRADRAARSRHEDRLPP